MKTNDDAENIFGEEEPLTLAPVAPVAPEQPDLNSIIKHLENGAGALRIEHEKLMSASEKYNADVKKQLDIQIGKVEVTLAQFENFCSTNLPKIIKQNIEGNYYARIKELTADIEKETKEALNKSFSAFGKQLTEFEAQAQRSADMVSNKSRQPLHLSVLHGAKWLVISLAFTFLILKVNTHLDKKSIDYGYKAKSVINSLPAGEAKRINLVIDQLK